MRTRNSKNDSGSSMLSTFIGVVLIAPGVLCAQTVDLVAHNGFEACWSQALTKSQFLGLMQSSLDNRTTCIGPQTTTSPPFEITTCNTAACPGGQTGCPVTLHSGAFSGDFPTGTFQASGGTDDISVPLTVTGAFGLTCTVTISNVTLTFAPDYSMIADGNSGLYAAQLTQAPVTLGNTVVVSSTDPTCDSLANTNKSTLTAPAETAATAAVEAKLRASTVAQSICPLTP
ncbi:MAG TPA: hypothetical protein VFN13_08730 [Rudaea sp.]|nr:hypothetical protein [Rudaea sp.]